MIERAWNTLSDGMLSWYQAKMFIEHASFVSSDALHVIAGVLVWIVIALALRKSLASSIPLAWLLALVLANEPSTCGWSNGRTSPCNMANRPRT